MTFTAQYLLWKGCMPHKRTETGKIHRLYRHLKFTDDITYFFKGFHVLEDLIEESELEEWEIDSMYRYGKWMRDKRETVSLVNRVKKSLHIVEGEILSDSRGLGSLEVLK